MFFDTSLLEIGEPKRKYELGAYLDAKFRNDPAALEGYWQSEKWFDAGIARTTFHRPKGVVPFEVYRIGMKLQGATFVGVRRTDYLWPERLAFHGVMPVEYYKEAMKRFPAGKFFSFSDDPEWTLENLGMPSIRTSPAWDIWLMSLCTNAIIANSSFHFWGSYLGPDMKGTVIAPKNWFAAKVAGAEDIVPERWIKL